MSEITAEDWCIARVDFHPHIPSISFTNTYRNTTRNKADICQLKKMLSDSSINSCITVTNLFFFTELRILYHRDFKSLYKYNCRLAGKMKLRTRTFGLKYTEYFILKPVKGFTKMLVEYNGTGSGHSARFHTGLTKRVCQRE